MTIPTSLEALVFCIPLAWLVLQSSVKTAMLQSVHYWNSNCLLRSTALWLLVKMASFCSFPAVMRRVCGTASPELASCYYQSAGKHFWACSRRCYCITWVAISPGKQCRFRSLWAAIHVGWCPGLPYLLFSSFFIFFFSIMNCTLRGPNTTIWQSTWCLVSPFCIFVLLSRSSCTLKGSMSQRPGALCSFKLTGDVLSVPLLRH